MVPLTGLPATPVIGEAVMLGPALGVVVLAAAMVTVYTLLPVSLVLLSVAVMVTV